jgi:hypothetical protein
MSVLAITSIPADGGRHSVENAVNVFNTDLVDGPTSLLCILS